MIDKIKFRVYDSRVNVLVKHRDIDWIDFRNRCIGVFDVYNHANGCSRDIDFKDCIIMQYTGLNDKNGNEIYEGDILDFEFNNRQYQVFFNECSFKVQRIDHLNRNLYLLEDYPTWDMEVIGNIYENPELLK